MNGKFYFTRRGLTKLCKKIKELEKKLQELQSQTAHVAEVGGDQYHDNASYEMLVIDIRGMDRRLTDAHRCINQAIFVEPPMSFDKVTIGTCVKIVRDGEEITWEIVGFGESDSDRNMLAYNTPLASLIFTVFLSRSNSSIRLSVTSFTQSMVTAVKASNLFLS